jgi:hypothetical protein
MSLVVPPYPPARYTNAEPEVSAWLRRGTDPPDHDSFGVVQYHYLAVKLYDGRDWIDGHQGDFVYVPPGGVHGFRNEAGEPASILMLFAPGAPREAYFEASRIWPT